MFKFLWLFIFISNSVFAQCKNFALSIGMIPYLPVALQSEIETSCYKLSLHGYIDGSTQLTLDQMFYLNKNIILNLGVASFYQKLGTNPITYNKEDSYYDGYIEADYYTFGPHLKLDYEFDNDSKHYFNRFTMIGITYGIYQTKLKFYVDKDKIQNKDLLKLENEQKEKYWYIEALMYSIGFYF